MRPYLRGYAMPFRYGGLGIAWKITRDHVALYLQFLVVEIEVGAERLCK